MRTTIPEAELTEKQWQSIVVDLARQLGWKVFHVFDSRRSPHGWPDLALARERLVFAELKTMKGRLTEHQRSFLEVLAKAGCETYVWRPSQLPEIAEILSQRKEHS